MGRRLAVLPLLLLVGVLLCLPSVGHAHVGSKDVFQTVHAGPYTLSVTVRPPNVIPGVATVEIRSIGARVESLSITPLPVTGEASKHPPASDIMRQDATDKAFYTGSVWIMAGGTWQVRIQADGPEGVQVASVPVVAVPVAVLTMQRPLGVVLGLLGLFLVVSLAAVVGASFREAQLPPGVEPAAPQRRRGAVALAVSLLVCFGIVALGGWWWNVEAADYTSHVFVPARVRASLAGNVLDLRIAGDGVGDPRRRLRAGGFLPDHGHLMHLYAIRWPQMDAAFHLHPVLEGKSDFLDRLPAMPPGQYRLFGDVVHTNGFPETLLATVEIPADMAGAPLGDEDAAARPAPLSAGPLSASYKLADGYSMVWDRPAALTAGTAYSFRFRLLDPAGKPATEMEPYLGMAGHAAFVKTDGSVFAHTHPEGSAAMADVMLANESLDSGGAMPSMEMGAAEEIKPEVEFPYGFPTPGRYRIFIQMKHAGMVETGVFDAEVK